MLWIRIAVAAALLAIGAYFIGRSDGASACDARHARAQLEHDNTVRKTYEKIDGATPFTGTHVERVKWLQQYTRP